MDFIRPKKPALALDMAPLIDIVFQLLIFFMLSSSFLAPSLKLNLPVSSVHDPTESEKIVVSISRTGEIFIDSERVENEELRAAIARRLERSEKKAIHIRGDKDMPYRHFVETMDLARQAGARQVNIVHEKQSL